VLRYHVALSGSSLGSELWPLPIATLFFEEIVEMCAQAGLVWGEEFYFDATKVEANASLESITPRFAVEQHLQDLFEEDPQDSDGAPSDAARATIAEDLDPLPTSEDTELISANAAKSDWISKAGRRPTHKVRDSLVHQ
jgi:hypothetical protein